MGISLSGGDYQYNRFDVFEASLEENRQAAMSAGESEGKSMMKSAGKPAKVTGGKTYTMMGKDGKPLFKEGKDASNPEEMKKKVDKAGKKAKKTGRYLSDEDEKEEGKEEVETASGEGGGMSEEVERLDEISKKTMGSYVKKAAKDIEKRSYDQAEIEANTWQSVPEKDPKIDNRQKGIGRAVNKMTRKEELNNQETGNSVMENDQRMAMYSRALGIMGAQYSGPGFGISGLAEKKEEEDKKESKGSKPDYLDFDKDGDKKEAMKKALKEKGEKEEVEEGYKPLPTEKMGRQANKAYGKEQAAVKAGDEAGANKQMQRRIAMNDPKGRKAVMAKEDVSITKEMVVEYLVKEGYASNEVSAEILHTHVSDGFLANIEESMIAEMGPAHPIETEQQAEAQKDRRAGKKNREGNKTAKNPGTQKGEGYNTTN